MRQRPDITNERIRKLYKKLGTKGKVAYALQCSHRLVSDSLAGRRKDPKIKTKPIKEKKIEKCSCCKTLPIKKGNRFLCHMCENKTFGFEEHSYHPPNPIRRDE